MLKVLTRQGPLVVSRDESGKLVEGKGGPLAAPVPLNTSKRSRTFRQALKRLTNNGEDVFMELISLARGEVRVLRGKDADGNEIVSEPQVPTPEVRRATLMDLHCIMHGKPVAETEVMQSEEVARKQRQLEAMSEEDLLRVVQGEYTLMDADSPGSDSTGDD